MDDICNDNVGAGQGETKMLTQIGLHIVQLFEQSDNHQSNGPGNIGFKNINLEEADISTIYITNNAVMDDVEIICP